MIFFSDASPFIYIVLLRTVVMQFEVPCDWANSRRPAASTTTVSMAASQPVAEKKATMSNVSSISHPLGPIHTAQPTAVIKKSNGVRGRILKHLEEDTGEAVHTAIVDTEGLLSRLPYKKMLNDMFGGNIRGSMRSADVPYVTRAYEEAFMREPMHANERPCANGKESCECMFIDRQQQFVGVEFLLPGEARPRTPHLCVLCCRSTTQQLYYDIMFDKMEFSGCIQRYGNIHSEPGEYSKDAMLIAVQSAPMHIMPLPIVAHQRNRYSVAVVGGIKHLKQSRVHFQFTPSC
jgi:hypothetical protein